MNTDRPLDRLLASARQVVCAKEAAYQQARRAQPSSETAVRGAWDDLNAAIEYHCEIQRQIARSG
jgi:hypothetical protein